MRFIPEHPAVYPNAISNKLFKRRFYFVWIGLASAFAFARTDDSILRNEFYTRPDLKPFPAMVKESHDYDQEAFE